jgi:hypothetical protein
MSVYAFDVSGVVIQKVHLRNRAELEIPGITWGKSYMGVVGSKSVKAEVMGDVESIRKLSLTTFCR